MQTKSTPTSSMVRNGYGAIDLQKSLPAVLQAQVSNIVQEAIKLGRIPSEYILGDHKEYECRNYGIYDVLIQQGAAVALVVQSRWFWKHVRKGYTRSEKRYYLLLKQEATVEVTTLDESTCLKRANNATQLGQLVQHYLGKAEVRCVSPRSPRADKAYKVLVKTTDGQLVSAFDESVYEPGEWRVDIARSDHGGGLYYFDDMDLAIEATRGGQTFSMQLIAGKQLVLCEVEVAGRRVKYSGGKRAASRLRVVKVLSEIGVETA